MQHKTLFYKMIFKVHNEEENYIQDFLFSKGSSVHYETVSVKEIINHVLSVL